MQTSDTEIGRKKPTYAHMEHKNQGFFLRINIVQPQSYSDAH